MAAFTINSGGTVNIDTLSVKAGNDTYTVSNGSTLVIDQDSRYGTNNNTSAAMGNITVDSGTGGTVSFDGRYVRLIPYNTGTGNVPASNTTISQGSASGLLIGVYSALNVAPTTAGSAMPASGYIKIKAWNSVAYTASALTGIGATATGADVAGWIEIVGVDAQTSNVPRKGTLQALGEWYYIGTTDGNRATSYQIPSNGSSTVYLPGVWVETGSSTNVYEFYPCAGSQTALVANIATDNVRGEWCWISTAGLLRFGNDGTNSTGAYIPPSGRRIRIPNIFFVCCTSAAPTVNVLPNATLATRYSTYSATTGTVIFSKICMNWFFRTLGCYSITVTDSCFMTATQHLGIKTATTWSNVGIGQEAANPQIGLTLQQLYFGGTFTDVTVTRATMASGATIVQLSDLDLCTFTNLAAIGVAAKANANCQAFNMVNCTNSTFTGTRASGGSFNISECSYLTFTNTVYWDHPATTTPITNGIVLFDLVSGGDNLKFDGLSFGGLFMVQPYAGILRTGSGQVYPNVTLRNLGTAASPCDLGGAQTNATWTRVTTTATVTSTAHGLKNSDNIYVYLSDVTAAIPVGSKTITVTGANTFTFTCTNSGATSGNLTYYPRVTANLTSIGWGAANLKIQRCYVPHLRTALFSDSGINYSGSVFQNVHSDYNLTQGVQSGTAKYTGLKSPAAFQGTSGVYGTHWVDEFHTGTPTSMAGVSWTRATTTATVTSNAHDLKTGDIVIVTVTSDASAIVLGRKSITALTANTFTFTCLNAGAASGTLTFVPVNGRIGIVANEASALTTSQYTVDSGSSPFTGQGSAYSPTIGNQVTWTTPDYIIGHASFPIEEAVIDNAGSGASIDSFDLFYAIDKNDGNGYSSFKNLRYQRAGAGGSASSTNVTMTSTTGVSAGDYVWGTGIAPNAKVSSITNSTTVVVDIANTGTVSGTLRFNQMPSETSINSQLGFKLKLRVTTFATNSQTWSGFAFHTYSTAADRAYVYDLDPVTCLVTVKDVDTNAVVVGAEVLLEATSGGALPAGAAVTSITRSGSTATVSHTAHGIPTNTDVIIRGVNQVEYRGSKRITVVDANTYTFTVAGTPVTPATGTITATSQILKGLTDSNGQVSATFAYTANQPVVGKVRKGTSSTFYKTGSFQGTITSSGLSSLVLLVKDQ